MYIVYAIDNLSVYVQKFYDMYSHIISYVLVMLMLQ